MLGIAALLGGGGGAIAVLAAGKLAPRRSPEAARDAERLEARLALLESRTAETGADLEDRLGHLCVQVRQIAPLLKGLAGRHREVEADASRRVEAALRRVGARLETLEDRVFELDGRLSALERRPLAGTEVQGDAHAGYASAERPPAVAPTPEIGVAELPERVVGLCGRSG